MPASGTSESERSEAGVINARSATLVRRPLWSASGARPQGERSAASGPVRQKNKNFGMGLRMATRTAPKGFPPPPGTRHVNPH